MIERCDKVQMEKRREESEENMHYNYRGRVESASNSQ